jgi:phage shock protein PspC (stress-responsive transcriptional regulator)
MGSEWDFRALKKSKKDKLLGGVCGGLGEHTPLPSWLWRVLFLVAFFAFGSGLLVYILLWIFMPPASAP